MELYLQNLLTGLGDGAVIAGVALGLVLAYQGSGVLNFAHGAMMMYSTYIYDCLLYTSPSPRDRSLSRMPSSA